MAKTMEDLFARYDSLKNAEEARQQAWQQQIYREYPVLETLDRQKKALLVDQLKEIMQTPEQKEQIKQRVARQLQELEQQTETYLQAQGIRRPKPQMICPLCQGNGYVQGKLCICMKEQAYVQVLGGQEIPTLDGDFAQYNEEIFAGNEIQRSVTRRIKLFLQDYAKKFPENEKKQILFCGKAGLGKSYLLHAFLRELQKKERDICCITAGRMFDYFHRHRLGEGYSVNLFYEATILAIDDLGSEPMTQNVTREYFFDLLCQRAQKGLYTFAVTNHSMEQLPERYTERVFSRLVSARDSHVLRFTGDDLRMRETVCEKHKV